MLLPHDLVRAIAEELVDLAHVRESCAVAGVPATAEAVHLPIRVDARLVPPVQEVRPLV